MNKPAIKVYCDSGGYRKELSALEAAGKIQLCTYVYENRNRKVKGRVPGSNPSWEEGDSTWEDSDGSWEDSAQTSEHWTQLLGLVNHNRRDAKHLDSAVLGLCNAFLTSDKGDVSSKAAEIYKLTGVRVFHFHEDWQQFVEYVQQQPEG